MWRRRFLATVSLLAVATSSGAQANLISVGVFSMLGDKVDVSVSTEAPRDTRLEQTERQAMDFKGIGFDLIALRAARDVLRRERPAAQVSVFTSPVEMSAAEQRAMAAAARNAELPAWVVKTIEEYKLSHVLLVTRSRGTLNAKTADQVDIGRGTVEGIGFHMDTLYTVVSRETGNVTSGLLAPHTNIRLMLMDTMSGEIVANHEISEAFSLGSTQSQAKADPWTFVPNDQKVRTLRQMVEQGMTRGMTELLRQR